MASTSSTVIKESKQNNSKETLKLLKRVIQRCESESHLGDNARSFSDPFKRAAHYTGLHVNVLEKLNSGELVTVTVKTVKRSDVHNSLMVYLLSNNKLPTTKQLFTCLQNTLPPYLDIGSFRNMLVKMNYVWRKTDKYGMVVMEKPTVTFERYNFLTNILQYRLEDKLIVYIDEAFLKKNGTFLNLKDNLDIARTADKDNVAFFIYAITNTEVLGVQMGNTFGEETFTDWIINKFIFLLPSPSVIVLNPMQHNSQQVLSPPTINSLKIELMEWLEYHQVPCNVNMSKAELFSLAEKYTSIKETYKIDSILKQNGHDVLRLADTARELSMTHYAETLIRLNFEKECKEGNLETQKDPFNLCLSIIKKIPKDVLIYHDTHIRTEEQFMKKAELNVDNKLEELFKTVKVTEESNMLVYDPSDDDSDVPSLSDSD